MDFSAEEGAMGGTAMPMRPFGVTGQKVTAIGLGGEGILRTYGKIDQARTVIQEAIAQGITYFDSAHVYADSEVYYGSVWREFPDERTRIFQASKSASRDRQGALRDLESTLDRLGTSYLDLWQIHDLRTDEDLNVISGPGGALEAFVEAKASGKVRFIGVTGHHDPAVLTRAVIEWPVDTVMMPVNPVEVVLGGFLTSTFPAAQKKGRAVIAMKVLGASYYIHPQLETTPEELIRCALSYDTTVVIVGCSTIEEVKTLAQAGRKEEPLSAKEKSDLARRFEPHARQLAFYRGVL
ncbi:MAG: aldo/keto reductase [Thermodesulfobacteriota bacterium]|nr:aldo/keto reductase [Thermodesulfobacteriota bacterium]